MFGFGWIELLVNGSLAIGFVALAVWLTRRCVRKNAVGRSKPAL